MGLKILPYKNGDEFLLKKSFKSENVVFHKRRAKVQEQNKGIYLIGWLNDRPISHVLLRFNGDPTKFVKDRVKNCVHIEAAGVVEEFQGQGIGTKLIRRCEIIAKRNGFTKIGMAVAIDNTRAIKLYEKLGYRKTSFGSFKCSWFFKDKNGKRKKESEMSLYLIKQI